MTLQQVYYCGKKQAQSQQAGPYCTGVDVLRLFAHCFGVDRQELILRGNLPAPAEQTERFFALIQRKSKGEPLQYLTGKWDFMDMSLSVGPGVLIPREDTIPLVLEVCDRLTKLENNPRPLVLDLCAGTGAVGLGIARQLPKADVICLELSEQAFPYLQKNISRWGEGRVTAVRGDVLLGTCEVQIKEVDAVVSNPPYICSGELPGLQKEVQWEPELALNGGPDGLKFYRAVARHWLSLLKPGGVLAVEIGNGQAPAVRELFQKKGIEEFSVRQDITGEQRVVAGNKNICS